MRKLRVITVDDEPLARKLLKALLEEIPGVELVGECRNGREAIVLSHELSPDLLILDIQMPGTSGFDVVKEIQSDVMPMVVFCTAYQRYALDAFDLHAVDYLLKPLDGKRLDRAIQRAQARFDDGNLAGHHKSPVVGAIDEIAKKIAGRSVSRNPEQLSDEALAADRKIAIKDNDVIVLLEMDDIDWVDAAGDYMCVHSKGVTHIMRSTLKTLMSRLDPEKFKRIHRSTVVNLERIEQVTPLNKGEYYLDLDCQERLKVSRNYRQAIKAYLAER